MAIEDLFDHRCSIYHLGEHEVDKGYGIVTTEYGYGETPDLEHIPCHFNVNASAQMVQQEPMNTYLYTGKLNLPAGTDIRLNDKVVNEDNGIEFTAQIPQDIRGHHMTVTVQRKGNIEAAL